MAKYPGLMELWSRHDPNPETPYDENETPMDIIAQLARDDPRMAEWYLESAGYDQLPRQPTPDATPGSDGIGG